MVDSDVACRTLAAITISTALPYRQLRQITSSRISQCECAPPAFPLSISLNRSQITIHRYRSLALMLLRRRFTNLWQTWHWWSLIQHWLILNGFIFNGNAALLIKQAASTLITIVAFCTIFWSIQQWSEILVLITNALQRCIDVRGRLISQSLVWRHLITVHSLD